VTERAPASRLDRTDAAIAVALSLVYLALLLASVDDLGYARDEGFYYHAARVLESFFGLFAEPGVEPFAREVTDRYFAVNHEHPVLMKLLFALSHRLLHEELGLFSEHGTAYRFPAMVLAALAVGVTYLFGRAAYGRLAALVAASLFAAMPAIFYHSHLACFDVPVLSLWLVTTYVYYRSLTARGFAFVFGSGVLYGLLLDTKHNAWLLPFALLLHLVITRGAAITRGFSLPLGRERRLILPYSLFTMATLGPVVFFAGWPWIWHDTIPRLREYAEFHLGHEYYNMEFLGRTYWKPPMPRLYAWVMTLATVPAITLLLFALGAVSSLQSVFGAPLARFLRRAAPVPANASAPLATTTPERVSLDALWAVCLLVSYAPWWSSNTPIFGGTKHWLTAYPFLVLFAGRGFVLVAEGLSAAVRARPWFDRWGGARGVAAGVACACLLGPVVMTAHSHPFGLSFYTPVVGGAPGAANLGLNRTFWGYTTGSLAADLNEHGAPGDVVYVHDTALQSWELMTRDGRVRSDLRGTLNIHASRLALYHHEPHMSRVEYQIWVDYGTLAPIAVADYDGVPIAWLYQRPAASGSRTNPAK
jgi:4-amino-4-deoxy-L-arabinose transferase-like glycosyltransferase